MRILKTGKKRLNEEDLTLDLENMECYCTFPYPDVGVTFHTKVLDIVLSDEVFDDEPSEDDIKNLMDRITTVIITESEKRKKTSGKRLDENRKKTTGSKMSLSEVLMRIHNR